MIDRNDAKKLILKRFEDTIEAHKKGAYRVDDIITIVNIMIKAIDSGNKILIIGNGGSASDASHMATELVVRFKKNRKPIPALSLSSDSALITAAGNDLGFEKIFERQCIAIANPNDVMIAISTSGNSKNIIQAVSEGKKTKLIKTIALSGCDGGCLAKLVDYAIVVNSNTTSTIQEVHRTIIHVICELIENYYEQK